MKKIILIACVSVITAGCADGKFNAGIFQSSACNPPVDVIGFTPVAIKYGDSHLVVIPVAKIRPNSEIRFMLLPQKKPSTDLIDYENVLVSVSSADDDGDTPADWLEVAGTYNANDKMLTVCVPANLSESTYKYIVKVDNVGMLDPRADVLLN
jgi:hypothetical protein